MSLKSTKVVARYSFEEGEKTLIPLFNSRTQAGFPSPGDDSIEDRLDLNELLVKQPEATFFVRVEGNSMEGAGIYSGDILVVNRAVEAKDGRVIVAALNGELVVKRLRLKHDKVYLYSEQEGYEPIEISDDLDTVVWGVVTASVHSHVKM